MTGVQLIASLGGWEGYRVGTVGPYDLSRKGREFWIELRPVGGPGVCSACGAVCKGVHDVQERFVRELSVLGMECWLLVHRRRVMCTQCGGPKVERLSWLGPWARHTNRFAESVARLCKVTSVKQAAALHGINWKTAKTIDKQYLEREIGPPNLSNLTVLAMDEFAIRKGQRYATIFVEPRRKEVLWVCNGHRREDVRAFFEMLGEHGRQRLEAVAMDMNGAYEHEVRSQCPNAQIVFDHYHVVAKYGHEVINRVRLEEIERLKHDPSQRTLIKGARWLLLRNPRNLSRPQDRIRLSELLSANRRIALVHILRDDLKHLWDFKYPAAAKRFWEQWRRRAIRSRIGPLKIFVRRLEPYIHGIIAHCRYPLHTSLLKGINNKIKVLKRVAYGYHDDQYFFLKIRQAFPGIGR